MANITNEPSAYAPDAPAVAHTPPAVAATHTKPGPREAVERGRMRKAANDGVQAAMWIGFFAVVAVCIAGAVAWGLQHRMGPDPRAVPPLDLPTLPGRTPQP